MRRADPIRIKRREREVPAFEPVSPNGWVEAVCIAVFMLFFATVLYLNIPEPMDCGVDRDAPTLEEGCPL